MLTLQQLLNIKSRSLDDYKAVFDRIDKDGSGFIESSEAVELLTSFYDGKMPPRYEVETFIKFFDKNKDGKISWNEFKNGFGVATAGINAMPALVSCHHVLRWYCRTQRAERLLAIR